MIIPVKAVHISGISDTFVKDILLCHKFKPSWSTAAKVL